MTLDRFEANGRERAETERAVLSSAVENFNRVLATNAVDVDPYLEKARAIHRSLPPRYQAEFRGVVDVLPFPEETILLYVYVLSDLGSDLAGTTAGDGCSNVVVASGVSATGRPLVLKNRDITARSLRPQTVVEYPSIGDYHGFLTVTSCGTPFVFQGVNRRGLVAANTFVDIENEDVGPRERIRNGVVIRRILEECDTAEDALCHLRKRTHRRMKGFTLALADAEETMVVEMDPINEVLRVVRDDVIVRTNHFPSDTQVEDASSERRLTRLRKLKSGFPEVVDVADLFRASMDHANGPGPASICRHHGHGVDETTALGQSTTVTSTLCQGGVPELYSTMGNPCQSTPVKYHLAEPGLDTVRPGQSWEAAARRP